MSSSLVFDTLAYAKKLKETGFTEAQAEVQAEALAEIIDERLATKQDILALKRDIKELEVSLKRDIKELEMRLTIRLGAMLTAGIVIVAALVKLL
jgi:predicted phage-related endonuclease